MTKHRSKRKRKRQFFQRNAVAVTEKAVAVSIHRGVMTKHRGERKRKGQFFQRNALVFIEKAVAVSIQRSEKKEKNAIANR